MKKLIQVCSLLGLLVLFTSVSAHAQYGFGSEVEIPFAFSVGDKSYEAGHYIVRVSRVSSSHSMLSIQDTDTNDIQSLVLTERGGSTSKEIELVFETVGGQKFLSKITTPDRSFAVAGVKKNRDAAKLRRIDTLGIGAASPSF